MVYVFAGLFRDNINRGARLFFDPTPLADMPIVGPIVLSSLVLGVIWLFAYWLFRHRVFIKSVEASAAIPAPRETWRERRN